MASSFSSFLALRTASMRSFIFFGLKLPTRSCSYIRSELIFAWLLSSLGAESWRMSLYFSPACIRVMDLPAADIWHIFTFLSHRSVPASPLYITPYCDSR
jgi:hypothetical protein